MSGVALAAAAAGTAVSISQTLEQGKDAETIAKRRAEIDIANAEAAEQAGVAQAEAVRKQAVAAAEIKAERRIRLIAEQHGARAAGNIRLGVGADLVIAAETREIISKDIGVILERARTESEFLRARGATQGRFLRSRADIERALGKAARRKSKLDALSRGLGFGSIAFAGLGSGSGTGSAGTPFAGTNTSPGFGTTPTPTGTFFA